VRTLLLAALALAIGLTPAGAQSLDFYLDPSNGALPVGQLTPLPSAYTFADTPVGGSSSTVLRVVNSGNTQITMSVVFVGKAAGSVVASSSFTVTGYALGSVIAPGGFKVFTVNFTPNSQSIATGYLQANVGGLPYSIGTISGLGTPPSITLSCRSTVASQCTGAALQPTSTTPINFGNVPTTSSVSIPFTLTNAGPTALNPQTLIAIETPTNNPNTPFSLSALPNTVSAGAAITFTVTFAPGTTQTFVTNLDVGSAQFAIGGSGTASIIGDVSSLVITYTDYTGVRLTAQPGTALNFGKVVTGTTGAANTLTFTVANPQTTISSVSVSGITVAGAGFSVTNTPAFPASIAPGASLTFKVVFNPPSTGTFTGTLSVGTRQFSLAAQGVTSPVPDATFNIDVSPLVSGRQAHLTVQLSGASTVDAIATVALKFTPLVTGVADDPAICFTATGGRQLQMAIAAGSQTATYNGDAAPVFQTGTTAGTLTFTLSIPNKADYTQSFTISPAAVQITAVNAVRQAPNLVVTLTGFDNTYSAGKMSFAFLDSNGKAMTAAPIDVDATSQFAKYFKSSTVGGSFSAQAVFPLSGGDIATVSSVSAMLTNSSGSVTKAQPFK
jgi:hypothetical protein